MISSYHDFDIYNYSDNKLQSGTTINMPDITYRKPNH